MYPCTLSSAVKRIESTDFKAKCDDLIDQVAQTGDALTITKDGKPVARLSACGGKPSTTLAGLHRDSVRIVGDIVSPVYPSDDQ